MGRPDVNGIDVVRALREQPGGAARPLVVASADASPVRSAGCSRQESTATSPNLDVRDMLTLLDRHVLERGGDTAADPGVIT